MAIADTTLIAEIQAHLIESAAWGSGMWTSGEVVNYLNERQRRLVRELGLIYEHTTLALGADTATATLDADVLDIVHLWWMNNASGAYKALRRADVHGLDSSSLTWRSTSATTPQTYNPSELTTRTLRVAPPSSAAGTLEMLYVGLTTALTGAGVNLDIPDVMASIVKWGAIADMLAKEGRGQDLGRAAVAEARYVEGREAVRIILEGWI